MGPLPEPVELHEQPAPAPKQIPAAEQPACSEKAPASAKVADPEKVPAEKVPVVEKVPDECFIGVDLELCWFFTPLFLVGHVLYCAPLYSCSYSLELCGKSANFLTAVYVPVLTLVNNFFPAFVLDLKRRSVVLLTLYEVVLCTLSAFMFDTSFVGLVLSFVTEIIFAPLFICGGCTSRQRGRFFIIMKLWMTVVQVLPTLLLRFDGPISTLPDFAAGMALPVIASVYSAVATVSVRWVNRSCAFPGVPVRATTSMLYMVLSVAQGLQMVGLTPRGELLASGSFSRVMVQLAGSAVSVILSELMTRTFALQRLKNMFEQSLMKQAPTLAIEPEMDSALRAAFVINPVINIGFAFAVALAIPGGASFAVNPYVWLAIPMKLGCSAVCDAVLVLAHRRLHPVPEESFLATRQRLCQPYMCWPERQKDGGRAFQALKDGKNPMEELSPEVREGLSWHYSKHGYMTDARLVGLVVAWIPLLVFAAGLFMRFGACGMNIHMDALECGGYLTAEDLNY